MANSQARERVLEIAEQLFRERGYAAVSMSDLAAALDMKKASLYHHTTGGKEELFVEVMERILKRYQEGLEAAINAASPAEQTNHDSFYTKLHSAAHWLLENPSLHYERMMQSDMPELSDPNVARLMKAIYAALMNPLKTIFEPEMQARGIDPRKVILLAGAFLSVIEGVHNLPTAFGTESRTDMADFLLQTLFSPFGLAPPR